MDARALNPEIADFCRRCCCRYCRDILRHHDWQTNTLLSVAVRLRRSLGAHRLLVHVALMAVSISLRWQGDIRCRREVCCVAGPSTYGNCRKGPPFHGTRVCCGCHARVKPGKLVPLIFGRMPMRVVKKRSQRFGKPEAVGFRECNRALACKQTEAHSFRSQKKKGPRSFVSNTLNASRLA